MHKKKRAQVTVYIIVGMIILLLAILLFYLGDTTEKKIGVQELVKSQKIPNEIKPITTYVTTSLDAAAREGLYLIGMQGGRIYKNQGGLTPDSIKAILYEGSDVSYGILRQNETTSYRLFTDPPRYPWRNFPCILPNEECVGDRIHLDFGLFGDYNLPPLNGSDPSNFSIESQLKKYITNYLTEHIHLSIFKEQGFDITEGEMNVSVVIGEKDVTVFLEYPLVINKTITNKITKVNYFYTNPQVRLKKVYIFVDDIINNDFVNITFDIDNPNNDKDNIWIEKKEDVYEHDDVIVIKDGKSMLYAEPYTFQFARENRNPALHFILTKPLFKDCTYGEITKGDIIPTKAYDPDEDSLNITYNPALPYPIPDLPPNKRLNIIVTVNDGVLTDWQKFEIPVTC